MEQLVYYTLLYDLYGSLLTTKQQNYFEDYYFHNLSLSELASKYQVSRNAIHLQLKDTIAKLENYEEKLHLLLKTKQLENIIKTISDETIKEKLQKIIDL